MNQVMGDGIMALFGAPVAHEDHAVRACYAALAMQAAMHRYADEVRAARGWMVQIRVGLNSGEVVVRAIGSDLHMDYTAVGQTTHLAARMEQLRHAGHDAADGGRPAGWPRASSRCKALGPVPGQRPGGPGGGVRAGRARPCAHALAGGRRARAHPLRRAPAGGRGSCGRPSDGRAAGHGQVVAVVGEPGIGKSRLVYEFIHAHQTARLARAREQLRLLRQGHGLLPGVDLLGATSRSRTRDDARRSGTRSPAGRRAGRGPPGRPSPRCSRSWTSRVEDPAGARPAHVASHASRTQAPAAREARRSRCCWSSRTCSGSTPRPRRCSMASSIGPADARLLLLVTYRPEYQHTWGERADYTQLRLDPPLPRAPGTARGPARRRPPAWCRSSGSWSSAPMATRSSSRRACGPCGDRRSSASAAPIASPSRSTPCRSPPRCRRCWRRASTACRRRTRRLLQSAAVIGTDVPFAVLQAIGDLPEEALRAASAHLQAAEFLYETSLFPELRVHLQARAHPGGGLREPAAGATTGPARPHRRGPRGACTPAHWVSTSSGWRFHAVRGEAWDRAVEFLRGSDPPTRDGLPERVHRAATTRAPPGGWGTTSTRSGRRQRELGAIPLHRGPAWRFGLGRRDEPPARPGAPLARPVRDGPWTALPQERRAASAGDLLLDTLSIHGGVALGLLPGVAGVLCLVRARGVRRGARRSARRPSGSPRLGDPGYQPRRRVRGPRERVRDQGGLRSRRRRPGARSASRAGRSRRQGVALRRIRRARRIRTSGGSARRCRSSRRRSSGRRP